MTKISIPCFAVIGQSIHHSLSPMIHQRFAQQLGLRLSYEIIECGQDAFETTVLNFFKQGGVGLNITSPFKEQAFYLAQQHTTRCQRAKAANTLWFKQGVLQADNTDGVGFILDVSSKISLNDKKVLILGAGGAARGVIAALIDENISELSVINRTPERLIALNIDFPTILIPPQKSQAFDLVINTIPSSDYFDSLVLKPSTYCYDLIYSRNTPTPFVAWAKQQGLMACDGFGMLVAQAAEAFFIWHGIRPDVAKSFYALQ